LIWLAYRLRSGMLVGLTALACAARLALVVGSPQWGAGLGPVLALGTLFYATGFVGLSLDDRPARRERVTSCDQPGDSGAMSS